MNSSFFTDLDPDVYKTIVIFFFVLLIMRFLLSILKKLLDHKLKNRIIEKGVSPEFADSLLQTNANHEITNNVKWFLIFLSIGIGLFISGIFLPIGIHSIAIMAISISIGFLTHIFYLKKLDQ